MSTEEAVMQIDFIVIGASICGLTASIALARAGHKATLCDEDSPFEVTALNSGCRIPPNSSKIYYKWGLEDRLRKCAIKSQGMMFASYESGSVVGHHEWEDEAMEDTGGDFLLIHYTDFRRVLAEYAKEVGVVFRTGKEKGRVVAIQPDPVEPSVTFSDGETLSASLVVGADGYFLGHPITRQMIADATGQEDTVTESGMAVYNTSLRLDTLTDSNVKQMIASIQDSGKMLTWFGGGEYGAIAYPIAPLNAEKRLVVAIYTPYDHEQARRENPETAFNPPPSFLLRRLRGCDPRLRDIVEHAEHITCVPIVDRPMLDEWEYPGGRILCIGEAAHPTPVGSPYSFGLATGDGAALGRLFAHLHSPSQIDEFTEAFVTMRHARVAAVLQAAVGNIFAVSLPPGLAEHHDRALQERAEKGIRSLENGRRRSQTSEEMMQAIEMIFGYDPEDEADEYWVQWGLTKERLQGTSTASDSRFSFFGMMQQQVVVETDVTDA
ncbi:hypothetical protein C8Q80DRAFT_317926 [Daedaleopsis nitida]|nr:hypothetical protein C8Q80DRAFT_317926 [Daedaleopsis nitida]